MKKDHRSNRPRELARRKLELRGERIATLATKELDLVAGGKASDSADEISCALLCRPTG